MSTKAVSSYDNVSTLRSALVVVLYVQQYATDVNNLIMVNLRMRVFAGVEIRMRQTSLCTENSAEHTQSYMRLPVWPKVRDSQHLYRTVLHCICSPFAEANVPTPF